MTPVPETVPDGVVTLLLLRAAQKAAAVPIAEAKTVAPVDAASVPGSRTAMTSPVQAKEADVVVGIAAPVTRRVPAVPLGGTCIKVDAASSTFAAP